MVELRMRSAGIEIAGEEQGDGPDVVLLHGLTATRRYVVMGSTALERAGRRLTLYDARGHGESEPAPSPDAYTYEDLAADLLAVLDQQETERVVLAGASMGGQTAVRFALEHPDRVAGLVIATPAFEPGGSRDLDHWDALSRGLREEGVDGFLRAYGDPPVPERWLGTIRTVLRQRLEMHRYPEAVADALRVVPRSSPFASYDLLEAISVPTVVIASRDELDPEHPYEIAERYANAIPGSRLLVEEEGRSPMAWQGAQVSAVIEDVVAQAGLE